MVNEANDIEMTDRDRKTGQGLMSFIVGNQKYGVLVGKFGYIVTENDFCYQVRSLNENIELRASWSYEPYQFELLTLPEIQARAIPITSYREWAHYWGIKARKTKLRRHGATRTPARCGHRPAAGMGRRTERLRVREAAHLQRSARRAGV
jgi:hypothetical protein